MNMRRSVTLVPAIACALACLPVLAAPKTVKVKVRVDSQAPGYDGARAFDGNPATMWHTRWETGETGHPHEMIVDLGAPYEISGFGYLPRPGGGNGTIKNYECYVSNNAKNFGKPVVKGAFAKAAAENEIKFPAKVKGRYLKIRSLSEVKGQPWASIAELRIRADGVQFRAGSSTQVALPGHPAVSTPSSREEHQWATLANDIRNRAHFKQVAHQALRPESLILESDRDPLDVVLRRTGVLLQDIKDMGTAPDMTSLEKELGELRSAAAEIDTAEAEGRLDLFKKACKVRRRIAFSNPLLSFDEILFIKRHRSGFNHMCDQYYGINARPGGGVFVLSKPFSDDPQVRNVLADSVVKRGRLKGEKLEAGSFLSPDLSYDAKQILFAYVECTGNRKHDRHTDPSRGHWDQGWSYHIFKVNTDGSGLEQLTDGTWNDFDPCWTPHGRVAFITERRGGYLRCGRTCPTYTLYDMKPDGSDITCLSFHETNEWHPSITHDGRIMYTRWDYVDRHGCVAHMPWITTLDGRDSRAVHGNFAPRNTRPDMEVDIRAIPGSNKYVATAAPHHGQAFGSLVSFDPRIEDDDRMAPVRRITPEVRFPESQGGAQVYATAWPLSEDYFFCVYDPSMKPGAGRQGRGYIPGNYGIYLVDSFGNKEFLYRDPDIACQSPIPLRPMTVQTPTPELIRRRADSDPATRATMPPPEKHPEASVIVINTYDSLKPWPEGTKITALRVLQVVPMSVPSGGPPHETSLRLPTARDSVVPTRYVLGTVPVEPDGSAYFTVPAQKEMFFQALDERGLAVQSMRSATYLHEGERLVCQGCHEPKYRVPKPLSNVPIALRRGPSRLKPDVDGSNPFSFPRLVQPVLDRHCVDCHEKEKAKTFSLAREPLKRHWYTSYANLAPKYGFWQYGNGHRTTPGKFGAYASKLYEILEKGHYDVKLSDEEMHRITLWLDCCSMFYGVYEREGGQAQLRGEVVQPTLQ